MSGVLGAVVGDQIGYWVGREGGRPFVLRWGRYLRITPERLRRTEEFFERYGGKAVFLARFVAGLRVFGALVAGISDMRWRTFFFYNALGGITWATAAVLVGYLLWQSVTLVESWLGWISLLLVALLVLALVLYRYYRRITRPDLAGRADESLNGERKTSEKSNKAAAILVLLGILVLGILVAILIGAYLGEWPWVWDLAEFVGWLLELL